jgi:hypothetical protein
VDKDWVWLLTTIIPASQEDVEVGRLQFKVSLEKAADLT